MDACVFNLVYILDCLFQRMRDPQSFLIIFSSLIPFSILEGVAAWQYLGVVVVLDIIIYGTQYWYKRKEGIACNKE
ncbi:MAG: hypothetical protein NT091_03030 [Candidatus Falkowbacteria bacterium]|nr:hypothetical protein [Candidatus Falkowbacteria bacterium]